jgi:hypothetical protein
MGLVAPKNLAKTAWVLLLNVFQQTLETPQQFADASQLL